MNVLIEFAHGLGDAVQFSVVLKHLRKYKPDWNIDVWGLRRVCIFYLGDF